MSSNTNQITDTSKSDLRDHLFISYAWEDQVFARWLALRLTAEGYKVWIDQLKLLGGESWPTDIDKAIKTRTFRVLGLLSQHSISKPNPVKERTLALNIAKQPGREGFLVPLNVDGLRAVDLDWLSSDITFISFQSSWANGLAQLLKLLEREECPRTLADGKSFVTQIASVNEVTQNTEETLTSNRSLFTQIPRRVTVYRIEPAVSDSSATLADLKRDWAFYRITPYRVAAFHPPPKEWQTWLRIEAIQSYGWHEVDEIEGIASQNMVINLLRSAVETKLRMKGFNWSPAAKALAFPGKIGSRVTVTLPDGNTTNVQPSGERTYFRVGQPKQKYRYRIAVTLSTDFNGMDDCGLLWRLRFQLTDLDDQDLPSTQRLSRRKHLTKEWHNYHWLVRHLAITQYCADDDGLIRIGEDIETQVILNCRPESFSVPISINEEALGSTTQLSESEVDEIPVPEDFEHQFEHDWSDGDE